MKKYGFLILIISMIIFFGFIFFVLKEMAIEDKYGEFYELYDKIESSENYLVIINDKNFGFVKKLENDIYIEEDTCLKFILNYTNSKIEVYKFTPRETFTKLTIDEVLKVKSQSDTKLIYKNP